MDLDTLKVVNEDLKRRFEERKQQHEQARPVWIKASRTIQRYYRGYKGRQRYRAKQSQYYIDCIPDMLKRIRQLEMLIEKMQH